MKNGHSEKTPQIYVLWAANSHSTLECHSPTFVRIGENIRANFSRMLTNVNDFDEYQIMFLAPRLCFTTTVLGHLLQKSLKIDRRPRLGSA